VAKISPRRKISSPSGTATTPTKRAAAASRRLREQIDLDGLRTDLEAVARETMQPERVFLWLPAAARTER
jgi:hypothetical protein